MSRQSSTSYCDSTPLFYSVLFYFVLVNSNLAVCRFALEYIENIILSSKSLQNSLSFSRDIVHDARIKRREAPIMRREAPKIHARASYFQRFYPSPTRDIHARSRYFSDRIQPDTRAKIRTVLQSSKSNINSYFVITNRTISDRSSCNGLGIDTELRYYGLKRRFQLRRLIPIPHMTSKF